MFRPQFQHWEDGEAEKLGRQQALPASHQRVQKNSIRLGKVSKQKNLKSVLAKFFQSLERKKIH